MKDTFLSLTILLLGGLSCLNTLASDAAYQPLSLADAIEKGLRENYNEKDRTFRKMTLDYNWFDTKEDFYLPKISLNLDSSDQRISRLKRGSLDDPGNGRGATGTLSLSVADYTVFNWGKDYLEYLNDKDIYTRSKKRLSESKRSLKFQIILKYFEVDYLKKVARIRKTQLRHASFVYRYSREKISLRKIGKQEYYQSRSEYLKAQEEHRSAALALKNAYEEIALLIADQPGTRYVLKNSLKFIPLTIPITDAQKYAKQYNPAVLNGQQSLVNAKRSYQRLKLENLPLPKFKVNLGAYTQTFGQTTNTTRYQNNNGNHIDVVATLDATWSLTGTGGLFNSRNIVRGKINKEISINRLNQAKHQALTDVKIHIDKIKNYEKRVPIFETRQETNLKAFDLALDNYLERRTAYINFQDTLLEMTTSQIEYARLLYLHAFEKVNLAQVVGLDEFPGETFEQLAGEATAP